MEIELEKSLATILKRNGAAIWGWADISEIMPDAFPGLTRAISFALAMDPAIMAELETGPTKAYAKHYTATNQRINEISHALLLRLEEQGYRACAIAASVRSDPVGIKGDFPHKTAATRAGLGWVGKNCQIISPVLGPWLRLGTVLTDAPLTPAEPIEKSRCGKCRKCVDACPAGALHGALWQPGLPRREILDAAQCDAYKKRNFLDYCGGHNCGICTSACPVGRKLIRSQ